MIAVKEAQDIILSHSLKAESEEIPLEKALNRILYQDIKADRDAPPFDRVTMDGIAVSSSSLEERKEFKIENIQAAGHQRLKLSHSDHCIEVMTGAMLPENTDCVIPYELIQINNGTAFLQEDGFSAFQNVHQRGTDAKKGDVLINKGSLIRPGSIGVLATVGVSKVKVLRLPKVVVCSTGDELVDIEQIPLPHQIRKSNVYMLVAALEEMGIQADMRHIEDDKDALYTELGKLKENYSILLFSGAVSKGKYDYLPEVLESLGLEKKIHGVAQRPGKPFLFGQVENSLVFGFPGNPSSTMICFHIYFKPWLLKYHGLPLENYSAILQEEVVFQKPLTYHLLVKISIGHGKLIASPVKSSGSGDLVHLAEADAVLTLPPDQEVFQAGEVFPVTLLRKSIN